MYKKHNILYSVLFCFFCVLLSLGTPSSSASQDKSATMEVYSIEAFKSDLLGDALSFTIKGDSVPTYTVSERFSPFRVVIDVANAKFKSGIVTDGAIIPSNKFVTLKVSDVALEDTKITRFEFTLADSHAYKVSRDNTNLKINFSPNSDTANQKEPVKITDFNITTTPHSTTISLLGTDSIVEYTVDTLAGTTKQRPTMYIDIANINVSELENTKVIGTSVDKVDVTPRGTGARFVFHSATNEMFRYTVQPSEKSLNIVIEETVPQNSNKDQVSPADSTLKDLLASSEKIAVGSGTTDAQQQASPTRTKFDDVFAGYNKERISVDFFKIDLHNVFRLFREVSGVNILVDESVTGSLTLAMNDVPWDFALDVILNLKNLEKEERFNTIVIYPKDKGFIWPNRPSDNLSIEADTEIISQEELIIEESASQSKEVLLAKELLGKAKKEEGKENIQKAVELYTQAFELWPENEKIANHLTVLYLVHLQMNAKALYYAQKTLALNADNNEAALYAAISSANMQRTQEASEYFAQSISHNPPSKEALLSFAAFSENNGHNDAALTLLKKVHANYGETLDSMVSVARIYDKQNRYKEANKQYAAILASGYEMLPSLRAYINQRLASQN